MSTMETNRGAKLSLGLKSALFGVGIPLTGWLFQLWLPQPAAWAIGVFLLANLFYWIPPQWTHRTFLQHFAISAAISLFIFVFVNFITSS